MDSDRRLIQRRALTWQWLIGVCALALISAACVLSIPWTFGRVESLGTAPSRRLEASNLNFALLAPTWWRSDEALEARVAAAQLRGEYVPGRLLGTDRLGRDFCARCLAGGAISLLVGLSAATITVVLGTLYGALSGYSGGRTDAVMMRAVDVLFGLPTILLVVLLAIAVEGASERLGWHANEAGTSILNLLVLLVAIGGVSWLTMARVIRGQVLSLRSQPFMEACRAMGMGPKRQFVRHLLPNLIAPIIVYATLAVPAAILSESFLSFLGMGVREPLPSWGNLAAEGLGELNMVVSRWWLLLWPCVLVAGTLLALNFIGDELRDRLDPLRKGR